MLHGILEGTDQVNLQILLHQTLLWIRSLDRIILDNCQSSRPMSAESTSPKT
ncbi:MAG: hypothetical protein CM15mP49_04790 [Actinomycetota bacterium]|nr:MAG: hypothetical protein CM15mP49_04790 [Actinomycetota bacterium]